MSSQAGAFRIAQQLLGRNKPALMAEIAGSGYVRATDGDRLVVPEEPDDVRGPYLAHLVALSERDEAAAEVFRRIGEHLAIVYLELEHILNTGVRDRFLFGGMVARAHCLDLFREGAARRTGELRLVAADSTIAATPLMLQLSQWEGATVAQFGQAVGAIYFANSALRRGT